MDIGDLTALFLCSKKTRKFIKALHRSVSFDALSFRQKKSLNVLEIIEFFRDDKQAGILIEEYVKGVNVEISNHIGFEIDVNFYELDEDDVCFYVYAECIDQQDQHKGTKRNLKIGGIDIPVVMTKKYEIYTFWDTKQKGFKAIGEYLGQKISPEISRLNNYCCRKQEYSDSSQFVINWMNSTNRIPKYCTIFDSDDQINKENVKFILDNVHPTEDLEIWAELGDQFQYNTHFNLNYLYLVDANWFSLENLFKTECKIIHLSESKLTNKDLNTYLKQWMEGKFPKLKELNVEMQEDMDINKILYHLDNLEKNSNIMWKDDKVYIDRNDSRYVGEILTPERSTKTFKMKTHYSL